MTDDPIAKAVARAHAGNLAKGRAKLDEQGKLFVRDRIALLVDPRTFVEDGLLANALAVDLPADGVVTGCGDVDGRPALVVANALNPISSSARALPASHGFGMTKQPEA